MDKIKTSATDPIKEERKEESSQGENSCKELINSGDELRGVFSAVQCNLNVVHVNCQSIAAHYMQMLSTFYSNAIDAILVSETFLKPTTDSNEVDLLGFTLIRNDRCEKGGGGVAIYLRENMNFKIVDRSPNQYSKSAEHLFIEISNEDTKVLLGVFYNPSMKFNYFPLFQDLLQKHRHHYEHFICLGDFNTNLLRNNSGKKKLLSVIDEQTLYVLPLRPTHVAPHSSPSILDLIILSSLCDVVKAGQLEGCFSYHDILYLSYRLKFKNEIHTNTFSSGEGDIQAFWQSTRVRESLAQQLTAMKKFKCSRTDNDFDEYQKCRYLVKELEIEFKREKKKCKKYCKTEYKIHFLS